MNEWRISSVQAADEGRRLDVRFQAGSAGHNVYFQSRGDALTGQAEFLVAAVLLPAMTTGGVLRIDGEISARFLANLPAIQKIYRGWNRSLRPVNLVGCSPVVRAARPETRVAAFFSGGVDSFYTLLKHREEITDLIFVRGFDNIGLDNTAFYERTSENIRKTASRMGKRIVEIETNLRPFLDACVDWGHFGHGTMLAAVGHLLSASFRRIYIASAFAYSALFPWGTHPELDPLWSSESLEFVHDGCEAARVEKVALLATSDAALQNLRVCWNPLRGERNCGRCEKCVRTMINLHVAGALERCTTFDSPLDLNRVARMTAETEGSRTFVLENLRALEGRPADEALCRSLRESLKPPSWSRKLRQYARRRTAQHPVLQNLLRRGYLRLATFSGR